MKYKNVLIIIFSILFFLTALTFYLNRVIFPNLIRKIAIERIEDTLKRKVEIGSIHLNWLKGFIIDKIKIYEKNSNDTVFAQADQVSFGVIFIPGFNHYKISIPFINVHSPSVHLIRTGKDTWNFSDMFVPGSSTMPAAAASAGPKKENSAGFEIALGGITISEGKFLVSDVSGPHKWNEYFDNINLKLALSYPEISYDLTADIPDKKGFIGVTVYYQPLTKNTRAQIHLKNIDTASYLSLIDIPDVQLSSGTISEINLNIDYTKEKTSAQGDVVMKNLSVSSHGQSFYGNINIHNLDAQYQNGDIKGQGQISLNNVQIKGSALSAAGSVQTKINYFTMTKDEATFRGSLFAQSIDITMKDRHVQVHDASLDDVKLKKDNDNIQSQGNINARGLYVQWPHQELQGDFNLKDMSMHIKNENDIFLEGDFQADNFSTNVDSKNIGSRRITLEGARLRITDQKNITLNAGVSIDELALDLGKDLQVSGSIKTDKLIFHLNDGIIRTSATLNTSKLKIALNDHKTIEGDPQLELFLEMPLKDPKKFNYKGSITISNASIRGFAPFKRLDNVELDADFQNDEATINALSTTILDTNVSVTGTVKNFERPFLNILAEADDLNLAKIKDIAPRIADQYGLEFQGTSFVKIKFEGPASDPLSGKILAVASVKNVNASSLKFHGQVKNITGIIEATPDSLTWRDFTATYLDKKYTFAGSLKDFKNPSILSTLNGPGITLKADLVKKNTLVTVNYLKGKYLNADFDNKGTITLMPGKEPVFDIDSNVSLLIENLIKELPARQRTSIQALNPTGIVNLTANLKGTAMDWKNYAIQATVSSPAISILTYSLSDIKINIDQDEGKVKNFTLDGKLYDGAVHAVGSLDLLAKGMPYDLALNIDSTDLHKLKMDSPLKTEEINGKFFLTAMAHGSLADFKNTLQATGSLAIRDGFLGEFNLFKGLLSILNDAMQLGQVMITDVDGNFTIAHQKINTDNLRLKGPTIVLLARGWVNFDQLCDLNVSVDLSSGVVPPIAHDVLNTLNIHIYDKIDNPKFKKKISMPQVINTLLKNLL